MVWRPRWRLPLKNIKSYPAKQSEAFKAARQLNSTANPLVPRCQRFLPHHGRKCRDLAVRGSKFCRKHGGWPAAIKAERLRFGKPITKIKKPRKTALATRGATEKWPEGLPKLARFRNLGPFQRGRLFEAWENRLMAPAAWQNELDMPRYRENQKP